MTIPGLENPPTKNKKLLEWVEEVAALTKPDRVDWCDGSAGGVGPPDASCSSTAARSSGSTPSKRPNSLPGALGPHRRRARRGPHLHLLASASRTPARPTTGRDPAEMRATLQGPVRRLMRGRTMYVVPFSMGPLGSRISQLGVEITDSPVRRGQHADHDPHGPGRARPDRRGRRLRPGAALGRRTRWSTPTATPADVAWPCNDDQVHRPLPRDPRDLVLRLRLRRQRAARQEVLRAAHRLGDGPRRGLAGRAHADPQAHRARRRRQVHRRGLPVAPAARPTSRCSSPTIPGWKVETVGDDIAWMRFGDDGRLYAINPEAGFFGVAPGTGDDDQRQRDRDALRGNTIFTNVALTDDGDVWWEGMTDEAAGAPHRLEGQRLDARRPTSRAATRTPASPPRPRSARRSPPTGRTRRACRSRRSCSAAAAPPTCRWSTRRSTGQHGVFIGATMSLGDRPRPPRARSAQLRRDPFAMLPVLRLQHGRLLGPLARDRRGRPTPTSCRRSSRSTGSARTTTASSSGPGFGENSRVLEWIVERVDGDADGDRDPDRLAPAQGGDLYLDGLDMSDEQLDRAVRGRPATSWLAECRPHRGVLRQFGDRFPPSCTPSSRSSANTSSRPRSNPHPTPPPAHPRPPAPRRFRAPFRWRDPSRRGRIAFRAPERGPNRVLGAGEGSGRRGVGLGWQDRLSWMPIRLTCAAATCCGRPTSPRAELDALIGLAADLKAERRAGAERRRLEGRVIALIFEKTSTRTRCAFEVGGLRPGRACHLPRPQLRRRSGTRSPWPTPRACWPACSTRSSSAAAPRRWSRSWPSTPTCRSTTA